MPSWVLIVARIMVSVRNFVFPGLASDPRRMMLICPSGVTQPLFGLACGTEVGVAVGSGVAVGAGVLVGKYTGVGGTGWKGVGVVVASSGAI